MISHRLFSFAAPISFAAIVLLAGCTTRPETPSRRQLESLQADVLLRFRDSQTVGDDTRLSAMLDGKPVRRDGTLTYRYFIDVYASQAVDADPIDCRLALVTLHEEGPTTIQFPDDDSELLAQRLITLKQAVQRQREARRLEALRSEKERAEVAAIPAQGEGKIIGHAFGKTIGGTIKIAALTRVTLIPDCALGRRLAERLRNNPDSRIDAESAAFGARLRTVTTDAEGRFTVENLPAHPYLAVAHLSWGYVVPGETRTTSTTETKTEHPPGFIHSPPPSGKKNVQPPPRPPSVSTTTTSTYQDPDKVVVTKQTLAGTVTPTPQGAAMILGPANALPSNPNARSADEAY